MGLIWITSDKIHDGTEWLPEGSVIGCNKKGIIQSIISENEVNEEVKHYDGIITPGFINAHCHLELSHMKGLIPPNTGLVKFLEAVMKSRGAISDNEKLDSISKIVTGAYQKGIVAFGDIANTMDSMDVKLDNPQIYFHTFIEALGRIPEKASISMNRSIDLHHSFKKLEKATEHLSSSIVPHAPYSISDSLIQMINEYDSSAIISIHSQECYAETELFTLGSGEMMNFYKNIGIPIELAKAKKINSLEWVLNTVADTHPLILVHNTFMARTDRELLKATNREVYCCLCPKANLYIENVLPPIEEMFKDGLQIVLGTDSLSSNDTIDILEEMKTIKKYFPRIDWKDIISWGTSNGAKALGIENRYGMIKPGFQPGLVSISSNFETSRIIEFQT